MQRRNCDSLNLPQQQVLHSRYLAILQSLRHNSLLCPGTPQEELNGFMSYPHHLRPRSYDSLNLPQQQVLRSPYSGILQSGGDPNFPSVPPPDSMEIPVSYGLEGWDNYGPSSLSSLPRQLGSTSGPPNVSDHAALTIVVANYWLFSICLRSAVVHYRPLHLIPPCKQPRN